MFEASEMKRLIEEAIPGAVAHVIDDAGDKEHFSGDIVSPTFEGMPLVRQHQAVYKALGARMGREIHAFSFKTWTPASWAAHTSRS